VNYGGRERAGVALAPLLWSLFRISLRPSSIRRRGMIYLLFRETRTRNYLSERSLQTSIMVFKTALTFKICIFIFITKTYLKIRVLKRHLKALSDDLYNLFSSSNSVFLQNDLKQL